MDRRNALKKLGMGGATVLGASMVMSTPAFADGGSNGSQPGIPEFGPNPGQLSVTLSKNPTSNDKAEGTVTIPSRSCPVGGINPARLDYGISHSGSSLASFTGDVTAYTTAAGPSVGDTISLTWSQQTGRAVTVVVRARWVCGEASSTDLAWSCGTWSFPFTANNGGTVTAGTPTFDGSSCPDL